ncbi:MAG: hypothetical protein IJH55_02805, partial [Romboutsia sp.]|nr:hypothetical protein [Romboutsia sp.]
RVLTSFEATNSGLLRLIRLNEQDTVNQFGIELQLKRMLNTKLFGDASYLQGLFDSVTSALIDASVATKSDITNFNSTVQTWLGAMYSTGLSDNVVNAIASGINALGSGNVNALASDESVQRLFLLSMDRIGMDYADILQQGLTSEDTNNLLASIIEYLNEIATNTSDNLVLKSSYSNLFNMSMSDMQAIQNVYSKIGEISGNIVNSSTASAITRSAVANTVAENTLASQMFENLFANFSYSFGSNIAENSNLYTTYRIADIAYNILDQFSGVGGALGKVVDALKLVPALTQFGIGTYSFVSMLGDIGSFSNNSLLGLLGSSSTGPLSSDTTSTYSSTSSESSTSTSSFKSFKQTTAEKIEASQEASKDWEGEAEDEVLGVLKELAKTLMKLKEGEGYAFAVSVEGMNDSVLRSFASIFADEDAMLSTFTGDNKVLSDALFGYFDDTTSNTNKPTEVNA